MFKFHLKNLEKALFFTTKRNFAQISIALVKELRNQTGSPIDECKKALEVTGGDLEKAREQLKRRGLAQAEKKMSRATTQGVIGIKLTPDKKTALIAEVYIILCKIECLICYVQINCETDFVAKNDTFLNFVTILLERLSIRHDVNSFNFVKHEEITDEKIDKILQLHLGDKIEFENNEVNSVYDAKKLAISKLQENIKVRRLIAFTVNNPIDGVLNYYVHNTLAKDIGSSCSVVDLESTSEQKNILMECGHNLAMQIMGSKPLYVKKEDIPKEKLDKDREIVSEQLKQSLGSKPQRVKDQMIEGKLKKYLEDSVLYYQNYVLEDGEKSVNYQFNNE